MTEITLQETIIDKKRSELPNGEKIERGETQKDVNTTVLAELARRFNHDSELNVIDLPCGKGRFLSYLKAIFPKAKLNGADIFPPDKTENMNCHQMDLSKEFTIPNGEQFDLITSISGVMMFGNTHSFIENCCTRLKKGGLMVVTNDNASTIIDRISFLTIGRHRQFPLIYEDDQGMTQNIPIQELIRLMRNKGLTISKVEYTSFYKKDLIYLPFALLFAPLQYLYVKRLKTALPPDIIKQMFGFKQYFYKHYIIYATKN